MKKNWKITICVFVIAFIVGLNIVGIMPVLSMVSEKYSGYSTSTIQLLQTIHYGLLMVGSLVLGALTTKFTKKKIVLAGFLVIGAFGFLPFLLDGFWILFVCRVLIGFGYGIVSPLNTAIIAEFFEPEKRAGCMGLHVVGMGIGAMLGNLMGGVLAKGGLRYFYLIYLLPFVGMLIIFTLLPETPVITVPKGEKARLGPIVYMLSLMFFVHTIFINAYSTNISLYLSQNVTADPQASGLATAVNAACAMLIGILFTKVLNTFKKATLPFSVLAAAVAYAAVLYLPGMAGALICSALCGVSLSCFSAMGSYLLSVSVEPDAVAKASGVYSVIGSVGGLIAPMVLGAACIPIGGNTPVNQFTVALVGMFLLAALVSVHIRTSKIE